MSNSQYAALKEVIIIILLLLPIGLCAQIENWVYRYNGPGNNQDQAWSIVYGQDGNIYAAGNGIVTGTNRDFIVISLASAGDTNWTYRYNGPANSFDQANSIVYGADGNIYAAGYSYGSGAVSDFIVISLASDGDTNWTYRYNGPGNSDDVAFSIVYGADGNIYAAGHSNGSGTASDFIVISLGSDGDTNWTYRYNGPGNSDDVANSIIYGSDGNIYAAGYSYGSGTANDFTVISLTSTGDENWVYRYNGSGNAWDQANSIIYGSDGNIYVAGHSNGSGTADDFTVISLGSAGDTNWTYRCNGPGDGIDKANSIVYGADGNIYAAGAVGGISTADDFAVISLTNTGNENWVYSYNGGGFPPLDQANSIVYGKNKNIYAAGYSRGSVTVVDFTVISLTIAGDENWIYRYNGPANDVDVANSIVYGSDGNIYAAGYSNGSGNYDFTVISLGYLDVGTVSIDIKDTVAEGTTLSPQATVVNNGTINASFDVTCEIEPGGYNSTQTVTNLAPDSSSQVIFSPDFIFVSGSYTVTGYTRLTDDENPANDTFVKVIATTGIAEYEPILPVTFMFSLPTVSRGKAHIRLGLPETTVAELLVYDVLGRLSEILVSARFSAGEHNLDIDLNLTTGVYFYKLKTGLGKEIVKKFLIIE